VSGRLRRLQIVPGSGAGPAATLGYDFRAAGGDVVVVAHRMAASTPTRIEVIGAAGRHAQARFDDRGSFADGCSDCQADAKVDWHLDLNSIQENLDVVVLLRGDAKTSVAKVEERH